IVIQYFGRQIHERFERIQAMFSDISARAQENFSGARVIRAYIQEQSEIAAFESANQEYIRRSLGLVRLMGMLWPTLELMLGIAVVIVLWLGGRQVLQGRMNVGDFVAFNTYMAQLMWPVIALGWVINIFQRGTASMARINEILTQQPEIADEIGSSGHRVIEKPSSSDHPITRSPDDPISFTRSPNHPITRFLWRNRIPQLKLRLQRHSRSRRHQPPHPRRLQPGHSRPDRLRQNNASQLNPAHLRRRPRHRPDRRPSHPPVPSRLSPPPHRIRSPGNFPLQRHHPRKHCLRRVARR